MKEELSPEVISIINKWKNKKGNLIMILHSIQNHYGYVPRNIALKLQIELNVSLARIYEVLTFYNFFRTEPPAKHTIAVCTGTACYLKGAEDIAKNIKSELNIKPDEQYTYDKKFKVEEVRCIGCCGLAPAITVDKEVIGRLKTDSIKEIIENIMITENS